MKTILIAHNYSEISFSAMSYHFAHYLANKGHRVVFLSHNPYFADKVVVKKDQGEIIVLSWASTQRPTSIKDFIWYAKIYLKYRPDIIVGHFVGSNISLMVSKIFSFGKVKTYEYYHTLTDQILADLKKITLKQKLLFFRKKVFYNLFCDLIICPSDLAKNDLALFYGFKKAHVILNPMMDRFKQKQKFTDERIILSFLGRLDPSKGVVDLVNALNKHKAQTPDSRIILNIAGTGRQEAEIKALIKGSAYINYVGGLSYDKIDDYLSKSTFAIIPSKFDNLPTVGLESLMNQTPLLMSNRTGLTHYLKEGFDCFKFDPTLDSMAALFQELDCKDDLEFKKMGENARNTYIEKFSMEAYCGNFSNLIL